MFPHAVTPVPQKTLTSLLAGCPTWVAAPPPTFCVCTGFEAGFVTVTLLDPLPVPCIVTGTGFEGVLTTVALNVTGGPAAPLTRTLSATASTLRNKTSRETLPKLFRAAVPLPRDALIRFNACSEC